MLVGVAHPFHVAIGEVVINGGRPGGLAIHLNLGRFDVGQVAFAIVGIVGGVLIGVFAPFQAVFNGAGRAKGGVVFGRGDIAVAVVVGDGFADDVAVVVVAINRGDAAPVGATFYGGMRQVPGGDDGVATGVFFAGNPAIAVEFVAGGDARIIDADIGVGALLHGGFVVGETGVALGGQVDAVHPFTRQGADDGAVVIHQAHPEAVVVQFGGLVVGIGGTF